MVDRPKKSGAPVPVNPDAISSLLFVIGRWFEKRELKKEGTVFEETHGTKREREKKQFPLGLN